MRWEGLTGWHLIVRMRTTHVLTRTSKADREQCNERGHLVAG